MWRVQKVAAGKAAAFARAGHRRRASPPAAVHASTRPGGYQPSGRCAALPQNGHLDKVAGVAQLVPRAAAATLRQHQALVPGYWVDLPGRALICKESKGTLGAKVRCSMP